jgi:hypothetical protein
MEEHMPRADRNGKTLKSEMKEAITEALQEQRELLREVFAEVLEDLGLAAAIREGKRSKPATRKEVIGILQSKT